MKIKLLFWVLTLFILTVAFFVVSKKHSFFAGTKTIDQTNKVDSELLKIKTKAHFLKRYCRNNSYSTQYCFIADLALNSGTKRFFVFDFLKDSVVAKGLVAHGSCNTLFLPSAKFSNTDESSCSSLGKYKIGNSYNGRFGTAYKLYGLEPSNSNAFSRSIVLHSYYCVPDNETPNLAICNSRGCPMVSELFLEKLSGYIKKAEKPMVLWIIQ